MTLPETAYLGMGSNMGDRALNLKKAVSMLQGHRAIRVKGLSGIYETDPVGDVEGGSFLNAAVSISTALKPSDLLKSLHRIEEAMGRIRTPGVISARVIDLDILLFGDLLMDTPELIIPHPRLPVRRFALEPLCELAPRHKIPGTDRTVWEIAREAEKKYPAQGTRLMGPLEGEGMP